jgi:hypothetical protein
MTEATLKQGTPGTALGQGGVPSPSRAHARNEPVLSPRPPTPAFPEDRRDFAFIKSWTRFRNREAE